MNCERARDDILRSDSGELSVAKQEALERHLATCEACRTYRADAAHILATVRSAWADAAPAQATMQRIRRTAQKGAPLRPLVFRRPVLHVLAAAATVLLLVGAWHTTRRGAGDREARIGELAALVALVSGDGDEVQVADTAAVASATGVSVDMPNAELVALAEQLLKMQGLSVEGLDALTAEVL